MHRHLFNPILMQMNCMYWQPTENVLVFWWVHFHSRSKFFVALHVVHNMRIRSMLQEASGAGNVFIRLNQCVQRHIRCYIPRSSVGRSCQNETVHPLWRRAHTDHHYTTTATTAVIITAAANSSDYPICIVVYQQRKLWHDGFCQYSSAVSSMHDTNWPLLHLWPSG